MTYYEAYSFLEYLERKGFLAGSLTAQLVMPVFEHDDAAEVALLEPITLKVRQANIPEWKES